MFVNLSSQWYSLLDHGLKILVEWIYFVTFTHNQKLCIKVFYIVQTTWSYSIFVLLQCIKYIKSKNVLIKQKSVYEMQIQMKDLLPGEFTFLWDIQI